MDIDRAIERIKEEYELAKNKNWIYDPLGYAIYSIWKEHNLNRKIETDLSFKCGNCKYAVPSKHFNDKLYVDCTNKEHIKKYCSQHKILVCRRRTNKACELYDSIV